MTHLQFLPSQCLTSTSDFSLVPVKYLIVCHTVWSADQRHPAAILEDASELNGHLLNKPTKNQKYLLFLSMWIKKFTYEIMCYIEHCILYHLKQKPNLMQACVVKCEGGGHQYSIHDLV